MVETFYGFKEKPFSLTPDPHFFYLSQDHVDALQHLIYGISEGEGFMLLSGAIGTGKTTLSRVLVEKLGQHVVYSLILNPFQSYFDLLKNILWDYGIIPEGTTPSDLINQLIEFIIHEVGPKGKTALIIIDEAQNLSNEILEQLRILSNIETEKEKLIQILLLGQEELLTKLNSEELRQLRQRISIKYFLTPLNKSEIGLYLNHRIAISMPKRQVVFTKSAIKQIYKFSHGIPRLINIIAARCLIAGFVKETTTIDKQIVIRAEQSLYGEKQKEIQSIENKTNLAPLDALHQEEV